MLMLTYPASPFLNACDSLSRVFIPQVLKLIAEHLFDWDEDLLRKWGEVFWRRMCDAYVRLHATPFVRSHADDEAVCGDKAEAARGLEEFAESLGLVDGGCWLQWDTLGGAASRDEQYAGSLMLGYIGPRSLKHSSILMLYSSYFCFLCPPTHIACYVPNITASEFLTFLSSNPFSLSEPYLALSVEALSQQMLCARQQRYLEQARSLISQHGGTAAEGHRVGLPLPVDLTYCRYGM